MNKKTFIAEILPAVSTALNKLDLRKSSYSYGKGYLAEADLFVHHFITDKIKEFFPHDTILSEESETTSPLTSRTKDLWILDPICGSTNFLKNLPLFVHSLCVCDSQGVLYSGIYDGSRNELFLADRSAFTVNGILAKTSQVQLLEEGLVSLNCNQSNWKGPHTLSQMVARLEPPKTRRLHILESANLEMAYVACGRLDAYVNPEDKVWDIAAGSLMIKVAGGHSKTFSGSIQEVHPCTGVIAANAFIFSELCKIFEN